MEIIKESAISYEEFKNIKYGTVFEYNNYFYIKMDSEARTERNEKINAVYLNNGETEYFGPTEKVKIVNASLIIKE